MMSNSFEEEMLFFFEEDNMQLHNKNTILNTTTPKEVNECVCYDYTKYCVC